MEPAVARRIAITRYLMIIGIVVLHLPPYAPLHSIDGSPFSLLKAFFAEALFRSAVPVLTVISGFLLFRARLHRRYPKLVRKKVSTLLLPMLAWNLPIALAAWASQRFGIPLYAFSVQLHPVEWAAWADALLGFAAPPINYPLAFLRDLFVLALLAPLLGVLLERLPRFGLFVMLLIAYANLEGEVVLRNTMLVHFYLGGMAALMGWNVLRLDRFAWSALAILCLICAIIVGMRIENREPFLLVSPLLVWPAMRLVGEGGFGRFLHRHAGASFFTFVTHAVTLALLWALFRALPVALPYPVFWLAAPVLTVLLSIGLRNALLRVAPGLGPRLLGGR